MFAFGECAAKRTLAGVIFGVGMAAAGFCPGTCAAGAGEGRLDYIVPGLLGFLTGAVIYGLIYPQVFPAISAAANYGNVVASQLLNVDAWLLVTLFALMSVVLFYLIDRAGLRRREKMG